MKENGNNYYIQDRMEKHAQKKDISFAKHLIVTSLYVILNIM